jgi:predicted nucleic-acid-binding Zn-ribbon protein
VTFIICIIKLNISLLGDKFYLMLNTFLLVLIIILLFLIIIDCTKLKKEISTCPKCDNITVKKNSITNSKYNIVPNVNNKTDTVTMYLFKCSNCGHSYSYIDTYNKDT